MIAYFKSRDVSVEVPDDMTEADLADIDQNFDTYFAADQPANDGEMNPAGDAVTGGQQKTDGEMKTGTTGDTLREWKPNFYQSAVEPILQELGVVDIPLVQNRTPSAYAVGGKAIDQLSFGLTKPLTDDVFGKAYEQHPIWSVVGDLAGGVGSLMATGGALKLAGMEAQATRAAVASTKIAAAGPRFVAPAIMTAATFGTHTFITKTVEALQKGGVDVADFGLSVVKDTTLGAALGSISGLQKLPVAIASAAGLGYLSSKMEGGDHAENLLNAGIWGIFEAVGGYGRDERLRRQALDTLSKTIGEYVGAKGGMDPAAAARVGEAIVVREAQKVGGIDAIVKSPKEKALEFIEGLNQKIRNGKVEVKPKDGETSIRIEGPSTGPDVPPFKSTNDAIKWGAGIQKDSQEATLKALDARIQAREAAKNEASAKGDFQTAMNIATENQFDKEAAQAIRGEISPEGLKRAGVEPKATTQGFQISPVGKMDIMQDTADGEKTAFIVTDQGGNIVHRAATQEAAKEFVKAQPLAIEATSGGPGEFMADEDRKLAMEGLKEDISKMEARRKKGIQGEDGQDQTILTGDMPDYLRNIGVTKAKDLPLLEKAIAGGKLTEKQQARVDDLIDRWMGNQEEMYGQGFGGGFAKQMPEDSGVKKIYHGTGEKFKDFDLSKTATNSVWFTDNKTKIEKGEVAASGKGFIVERYIDESKLKLGGWAEDDKYTMDELIQKGYDGLKLESEDEITYRIFNPEKLMKTPPKGARPSGFAKSAKDYASSRPGSRMHNYTTADQKADLLKSLGGMDKIQKMQSPELVKLARTLTGDVPIVKKLFKNLGFFRPRGAGSITMNEAFFKDVKLIEAVLAHEIGHLFDYLDDKTMKRGNILGRLASLKGYHSSLLPESPTSTETILTPEDRRRFRSEAEKIARARANGGEVPKAGEKPKTEFDPQAILDVWNSVTSNEPALAEYVARLSTEQKKAIIRAAMEAMKKGEKLTLPEVAKFNKQAAADPASVAAIYRDLINAEIKKRRLWEEEVILQEMKDLSMYWEPFVPVKGDPFTTYRFSAVELYADFVSVLLNAPAKAKQIAPKSYEAFFNYLDQKPEVLKALIEIQSYIQGDDVDLQRVRGEDILAMYERGEDAFRARQLALEASKKSTWDKFRLIFIDKNAMLLDQRDKLKKRQTLAPADDAQYAIEKNSMMSVFIRSHLTDYDRNVYFAARDAGVLDEVKTVLFLDRVGADRSELANPLGHTPETAKAFLDSMKATDPVKFQKIMDLAQAARDWFRDVSQIPGSDDFFTPEQRALIQNSDKYAPFRVVDYMKDYMAAGFSSQMGTFKDIGDPLTSLAMKGTSVAVAVERNRLKKITGEMLLRSGLSMTPAKISNEPGHFKIEDPTESYLGTLAWKDGGKWKAYHLDKTIADTFNGAATEKIGLIGGTINNALANPFFRATFITFNPGFQAVNLIRDFGRTWKTVPGLTLGKAFRLYAESLPEASRRAKGVYDPTIQEMERAGALQITLNDIVQGQTPEDTEIETFLNRYGVTPMVKNQKTGAWEPAKNYQGIPIWDQIRQLMDTLRYVGDTIETLPKVVGWKALDQMDVEERAYFVRNLVGTPNPKRAGIAAPIGNAFFMFSNIFKEGFRGLIEAGFTNEKTRKAYWKKTAAYNLSLRVAMGMAAAGFFGAGVKTVMDKASEYHKANYIVIPLGIDDEGNGIYATIPQDEDARLIGAIAWKALNHEGNLVKNLSDVLSFGAGNFPGLAPAIDVSGAWLAFLSGKNPRDTFRDQEILTDQEFEAGGMDAFEPMARWTVNETGLVRLDVRDRFRDEPIYKTAITSIPIVQRFIRVGRQGEREKARLAASEVKKTRAQESLDLKDQASKALKEGKTLVDFLKGSKTDEEINRRESIYNSVAKKMTDDPIVQALNSATSNDEKVAILKKSGEGKDPKEYDAYLNDLYKNKVITGAVLLKVRN